MSLTESIIATINTFDWGSVPEWLAAIGTIAAVIVALVIAGREGRETRKRERRQQAESISTWRLLDIRGKTRAIVVTNPSSGSIYEVAVSIGVSHGAGPPYQTGNENQVFIAGIPPGKFELPAPPEPKKGMHIEIAASISFRDSHGVYWRQDATGNIIETNPQVPYADLDVSLPIDEYSAFTQL